MTPEVWLLSLAFALLAVGLSVMVILLKRAAWDAVGDVLDAMAEEIR